MPALDTRLIPIRRSRLVTTLPALIDTAFLPFFPLIADLERFCLSFIWKINHSSCPVTCPVHYESTGGFEPYQVCCYERFEPFTFNHTSPSPPKCWNIERKWRWISPGKAWGIIPKQRTNLVSVYERLRGHTFYPSGRACSCKKIVRPFCSDCLGLYCINDFAISTLIADSRYKYSELESAQSWALAMSIRSK